MKNNLITKIFPIYLLILCFILPLNFFIIGEDMGIGMQGAFYRYQVTGYGTGFFPLTQDLSYIISGIYEGKTALSVVIWAIAAVFLAIATTLALITYIEPADKRANIVCFLMAFAGVGFLISVIIQYGPFLQGPAGLSIPFEVPALLLFSIFGYKMRDTFF